MEGPYTYIQICVSNIQKKYKLRIETRIIMSDSQSRDSINDLDENFPSSQTAKHTKLKQCQGSKLASADIKIDEGLNLRGCINFMLSSGIWE